MEPRESAEIDGRLVGEAFRLEDRLERAKQILKLQGLGLWHGDLSRMRNDPMAVEESSDISSAPSVDDEVLRAAAALRLRIALERLDATEREMLFLRFSEDLSTAEIAKRLNLSVDEARQQLILAFHKAKEFYVRHQAVS